ncbi:MAG: NAD(P)-dependent oxidoreductase [Dorea sp.]|nr:NAD(P)-dependent oxidoreductase [Dorea sp.]
MKIVITGGNSFIGKALARKAAKDGNQVVLVVRSAARTEEISNVSYEFLPMEQYKKLGSLIGTCDCMINLSWDGTRGSTRMDRKLQQGNYKNTMDGIISMLETGCRRIVTAGSQAEYGHHDGVISEKTPCCPNTEYGIAKLNLYESVRNACSEYKAELVEPRFFSLYGPGDYSGTMIMSTLTAMLKNMPCRLSAGVQMWDYLYLADAIDGVWKLCTQPCESGAYNLGSGDVRTLKSYVMEMAEITKTESELHFGAVPYPETGMVSIWPDISKMRNELGWKPQVSFKTGVSRILKDMKKEGTKI